MEHNKKLVKFWQNKEIKNAKYEIYRRKKIFYDRLIASIRKRAKKVVIGNYNNKKGMKFGQRLPPIKLFKQKCKSNHLDISEIDEYNSSKFCYKCRNVLRNFDADERISSNYITARSGFSKLKYCDKCKIIMNRDLNASVNMGLIYMYLRKHNERPKIFDREFDRKNFFN